MELSSSSSKIVDCRLTKPPTDRQANSGYYFAVYQYDTHMERHRYPDQ